MGVFGTTYKSAFSGLGKPSIKLEFEDNDQLLAFQRRIDGGDGDDGGDTPDGGGNFTPGDRVLDSLSRLATGRPYLKATRGGEELEGTTADEETRKYDFYLLITSEIEPINSQKFTSKMLTDFEKQNQDFKVKTPIGDVLISRKLIYGYDRHLFKHIYYYFNVLKRTLEDPICIFKSTDDKGNANKTFVKCFYMDGMELISIVSPVNPVTLDLKTTYKTSNYNQVWELVKRGGEDVIYSKKSINDVHGLGNPRIITPSIKVVEFRLPMTITENGAKSCNFNENSLGKPGDLYVVRDLRTRSRKEPGDLSANKNLRFVRVADASIKNFDRKIYDATDYFKADYKGFKRVYVEKEHDHYYVTFQFFVPLKKVVADDPTLAGWSQNEKVEINMDGVKNYNDTNPRNISVLYDVEGDRKAKTINKEDKVMAQYYAYITDDYYRKLQNQAFKMLMADVLGPGSRRTDYQKKLFVDFYKNPSKYKIRVISYSDDKGHEVENKYRYLYNLDNDYSSDLGRAGASDALYNDNDILDCRGMVPTYKILDSYDAFFAPAQHSQTFAGVGLDDTKKLIADICKVHYKDCARIAQHLKADTKLQSVFNLWHWLRHNIRYEYDREGREEVRTPLRTWADRRRGVDCDCLSVFAWCVLKCMGYDPAFELVCFKGKKQPSHILVNLDGIRCDRVWFVFNSLPPGVTNSEIYRLTDRATAAQLAGLFN